MRYFLSGFLYLNNQITDNDEILVCYYNITIGLLGAARQISNNKEKEQLDCSCSEYNNRSVIGTNIRFGKMEFYFSVLLLSGLMWQMKTEKMNMKNLTLAVSLKKQNL